MPSKSRSIISKTDRKELKPRREPYWSRVAAGEYLGFRVINEGEGTWIARWRNEAGGQNYRALGHCTEYDEAAKLARDWFNQLQQGASPKATSVEAACKAYVGDQRIEKGNANANDAEGRFRRLIYGTPFGAIRLDKLTTIAVRRWRDEQIDIEDDEDLEDLRRAKDSANRNLSTLKAALNRALRDRMVATDAGWKTVTAFKNVGERRSHFLTLAQRTALLNACPEDLRLLVKALLLTGARPGEIAATTVADFDAALGTLELNGKTGRRTVSLSTAAIDFFTDQSKDKIGNAPMLTRSYGDLWNKDAWKKIFKDAVRQANLPNDIVMYSLRHTAISEMISSGMDTFIVARLAGTSTAMIDKHYGHLRHDKTRARLDAVAMF